MNSFLRKCFHQSLPYLLLICPFLLLGQGKLTIYAQGVKWHREVPREIDPESVIALNWTRFKLKQISDSILKFKNLEYLDISWNPNLDHTQAIEVISKLQKLKGVSFEFNELNDIPNEVLLLKQLKWLSFNNNKLKKVNPCLTELTSLEVLVLGYKGSRIDIGNKIEEIPEEFHDLKELKELRF